MKNLLKVFPFIAILRGIRPEEAVNCGEILYDIGFRILEVPLNSPKPFSSISRLVEHFGTDALLGAGTVTTTEQVAEVASIGGQLIVSPHCDVDVIRATKDNGLLSIPGVATPTEALSAIRAGADALKLFPGEMLPPHVVKAIRAVLPEKTVLLPVGGIDASNYRPYLEAGADGFGLGSSLYHKGITREQLTENGLAFKKSWEER